MDGEPLVSKFAEEVQAVVGRYCDQGLTVAEALGAFDLVKAQIIRDAMEDRDEDN